MKKVFVLVLITALILVLAGCSSNKPGNNVPGDDETTVGTAHVSFIGQTGSTMSTAVVEDDLVEFTKDIYKEPYKSNSQGNLAGKFTPTDLVVPINEIGVAHPDYSRPLMLTPNIEGAPGISGVMFNVSFANDIIEAKWLAEEELTDFEVAQVTMWTKNYGADSNNNFGGYSEVKVDMGEEYKDVVFPNEDAEKKNGTVHVFQLKNLIPLPGENSLVRIQFDHNVNKTYIINPDGSYVGDFNPYFWEDDSRMGIDGYVIYRPGIPFGLTNGDKNLIFSWYLHNLIEVYDNGTPSDTGDDLVTLRLDNPFPIDFRVENYQGQPFNEGDGLPPEDVSNLEIRYFNSEEEGVYLRWLNPATEDLKTIHIIRKVGSEPVDINDGTEVYSDRFPAYADKDIAESGVTYYYKVFVEDNEGLFSTGNAISIDIPDKNMYGDFAYGDSSIDVANDIIETDGNNVLLAGQTNSQGAGGYDVLLLEVDEYGNIVNEKTIGGNGNDGLNKIIKLSDGGYVFAGDSSTYSNGSSDMYVVKLDSQLNEVWSNNFGGSDTEYALSIAETSTGDIVVCGSTRSEGNGNEDIQVRKLDQNGNLIWSKNYGGVEDERGYDIKITDDGSFIVAGYSYSFNEFNEKQTYLIKLDSSGNLEWEDTYFETSSSSASAIHVFNDNYWVAGEKDGMFTLSKVNSNGSLDWTQSYGNTNGGALAITEQNGDFVVSGVEGDNAYLVKVDYDGYMQWEERFGSSTTNKLFAVQETSNGNLISGGYTGDMSAGDLDVLYVKVNSFGKK